MDALTETKARFQRHRKLIHFLGFLFGVLAGGFIVFQIFFLARVLPHGGL